ncbi:MAG: hypothetical protein ACHQRM_01750 [Bacteroidia bacterium]
MKPDILKQKMESLLRRIDDPAFLEDMMNQIREQVEKEKLSKVQADFAKTIRKPVQGTRKK